MPIPRSILREPHRDLDLTLTRGQWPADISGEIFLSAPAPSKDGGYALFNHGVLNRLSLRPGTHGAPPGAFAWRSRDMATPSARLATRRPELFERRAPGTFISEMGALNAANTAPLVIGDRLYVTWDGGRPIEVDPLTMGFLGEVGHRRQWVSLFPTPLFPMVMTSAHPALDPDRGCLWSINLGIDLADTVGWSPSIVRHDGDGPNLRSWPIEGVRLEGVTHSISQTRDWLVLAESGNFKTDPGEMGGGERSVLIDLESSVLLVRKDDLDRTPPGQPVRARTMRIRPPTGHYHAVYDDREGVRVLFEHMDNIDLGFSLRPGDRDVFGRPIDPSQHGMYAMGMSPTTVTEVVMFPESGKVEERARFRRPDLWDGSLSAMDLSPAGLARPTLHHLVYFGFRPGNIPERMLSVYRARVDPGSFPRDEIPGAVVTLERGSLKSLGRWDYGIDELPMCPTFVPRVKARGVAEPGGHDGYVLVPVLSDAGFRVELFDANRVGRGPLAVLATRETVSFLLHSAFMLEARAARPVERLRFIDELDAEVEAALGPEGTAIARALAEEVEQDIRSTLEHASQPLP